MPPRSSSSSFRISFILRSSSGRRLIKEKRGGLGQRKKGDEKKVRLDLGAKIFGIPPSRLFLPSSFGFGQASVLLTRRAIIFYREKLAIFFFCAYTSTFVSFGTFRLRGWGKSGEKGFGLNSYHFFESAIHFGGSLPRGKHK